jgi:hypothetical protein
MSVTREELHSLIDRLPDSALTTAAHYLQTILVAPMLNAPDEDEALSAAELAMMIASREARSRGEGITQAELLRDRTTRGDRH